MASFYIPSGHPQGPLGELEISLPPDRFTRLSALTKSSNRAILAFAHDGAKLGLPSLAD